jgi:putative ABC transport system permease protein
MRILELRENFRVAGDTIRAHKVRSGLTILGIVIGVTSVISVASIIDGLNQFVQGKIDALGSRTFFITRFPGGQDPNRLPLKYRIRKYINYSDAAYLRESCPDLDAATTFGTRAFFFGQQNSISYGTQRVEHLYLRGAEPDYLKAIPAFNVDHGRFITQYDETHARPVVVIGTDIADALFPRVEPLGKVVRLNGGLYEVVGVFQQDSGFFGLPSVNQFAVTPLSDFHKNNPDVRELAVAFLVRRDADVERTKDQVREAMRRRRHVPFDAADDFEIISPDFISSLWNQLTGALAILTGVISSIGLLVGGIGVMNIMLISVTERTSEIGVRKAVGARRADIRVQFLVEAAMLTSIGGAIGIALGASIAFAVRRLLPSVPAQVSYFWIVLGVAMSAAVGLSFGYYPANRAANLDPIACLRYE